MKYFILLLSVLFLSVSCEEVERSGDNKRILFLTHSTGRNLYEQGNIPEWFEKYNHENLTEYAVERLDFPKAKPYGWNNYPYDYWKIWVQKKGFKSEPSLKKLSGKYDVIVWKHCFPGSAVEEDPVQPDIKDRRKSLAVYRMQYEALKGSMHTYPDTEFIVWTLAVMREEDLSEDQAARAKEFVEWVKREWDEPDDNIHVWDFYEYETTSADGKDQSLYLRPEYSTDDSHPSESFNLATAPFLCEKIVNIINEDV